MSDARFFAKQYIDAGWAVIPIERGVKEAASRWNKKTYTVDDFSGDSNIAGKCGEASNWRVDLDCDMREAVDVAAHLVPRTGLVHGRPGKPDSHYWFLCPNAKTTKFNDPLEADVKSRSIVEIRSSGGYTVLPPSVHPSGDVLAWTREEPPFALEVDTLYDLACDIGLGAMIVKYWRSLTHDAMGHLAGFWLQGGMTSLRLKRLFKAIGQTVPGNYTHEILQFAERTIERHEAGDHVSGAPKLKEYLDERLIARMRSWLKMEDADALEAMNAKHFIIRVGKDVLVGLEEEDNVIFQWPQSVSLRYENKLVAAGRDEDGEEQFKPVFEVWRKWSKRREYRNLVFAPPPRTCDAQDYNLWKGFAVQPAPGDCRLFLDHIREVICDADDRCYHYLLDLLALTVQQPGIPSEVAVVLRGEPGAGKGSFVRAISRIFGRHAAHIDKVKDLVGDFNASLSGAIVVFADEAFWAGDKREVGSLKRLITEPTLRITRKGIDSSEEPNCVHLFMATNEDWSYPAMLKERRALLLEVSPKYRGDFAYFDALETQLKNGGLAAFLAMMIERPVEHRNIRNVPKTKEMRLQQIESLAPHLAWWHERLYEGRLAMLGWPAGDWVPFKTLHELFEEWSRGKRGHALDAVKFGQRLSRFISAEKSSSRRGVGGVKGTPKEKTRCLKLRTLDDARAYFDKEIASETDWDEPEVGDELF